MKIVMVAGHACIRVQKMAIPLIEKGHEVHLIAMKIPSFWQQYKTFTLCTDVEQMLSALDLYSQTDVDLFHCHNEPSWFVSALKERTDKPVILDVHDSYLARSTPDEATQALDDGDFHVRVSTEERNNFQLADALVFPGDDFRKVVCDEFKLEKPTLTLPSFVPARFYQYAGRDWHGGLVYEGKINLPTELTGVNSGFQYCEYTELAKQTDAMGMDLHLYSARDDDKFREHYKFEHTFVHRPLTFDELLPALSRHDWGLVGNVHKSREWDVAMPNKLFEYLAAGVPVAVMNANACAEIVKEHGVGIVVDSVEELGERWGEHEQCRDRLYKCRREFSMNARIHELEEFYGVVCAPKKRLTGAATVAAMGQAIRHAPLPGSVLYASTSS